MARAIDERADGLLPVVPIRERHAFEIVAAGQAQELRVHGGHALHQVGAVAVGAIVEGWRQERDQLQPHRAGMADGELEMVGDGGRNCAGGEFVFVTLPRPGLYGDLGLSLNCSGGVVDHVHCERAGVGILDAGVERAGVGRVGTKSIAPVAGVGRASLHCLWMLSVTVSFMLKWQGLAGPGGFIERAVATAVAVAHEVPRWLALPVGVEGAVLNHLGVEAAVVGVIDLLGHQAVERGADRRDDVGDVDRKLRLGLGSRVAVDGGGDEQYCANAQQMHRMRFAGAARLELCVENIASTEHWITL